MAISVRLPLTACVGLAAVCIGTAAAHGPAHADGWTVREGARTVAAQGGWRPERWLGAARSFAGAVMRTAPDRYGPRKTPLWLGIIDPAAGGLVTTKPPNWQTYWDAEDYVMTAQGANVYRDLPMLSAFQRLTRDTGDRRYADAVDRLLRFFLRETPSKTTGLFAWGEHMSYNTVRDRLIASRHEMEQNIPDWEMLWRVNPDAVRREIEAIWRISVWDKDTFVYDRHANYYTGVFDALPVRGSYIKHSGLFACSILFLYSKTHDPQHLAWARGLAGLYWRRRDPHTGLVPGYVGEHGGGGDAFAHGMLAWYLLEAARAYPDPEIRAHGLDILDATLTHGFDARTGEFASQIVIATGKRVGAPASPWVYSGAASYYPTMACLDAYELTHRDRYLRAALAASEQAAAAPVPDTVTPEAAGIWLGIFTRTYRLTGDVRWLRYARALGEWVQQHMVRHGLVIESPVGYVYHNFTRPGWVLDGWLALHEAERTRAAHWTAPPSASPDAASCDIEVASRDAAGEIRLRWRMPDGRAGSAAARVARRGTMRFRIPLRPGARQGMLRFAVVGAGGRTIDEGALPLARNAAGPRIGPWRLPRWAAAGQPLTGRVRVTDPSGVVRVRVACTRAGGSRRVAACRPAGGGWYAFETPIGAIRGTGPLSLTAEAAGNPGWPVTVSSPAQSVPVAERIAGPAGAVVESVPGNPAGAAAGLPAAVASRYFVVRGAGASGAGDMRLPVASADARAMMSGTVGAYRWTGARWERAPGTGMAPGAAVVSAPASDGMWAVAGEPRLMWRRAFAGALLSSPGLARIRRTGPRAIVLDGGVPDGALFALDPRGRTVWEYNTGAAQTFAAIADIDGDGLDEIAVGGETLALLGPDGKPRWRADLPDALAPVIGRIGPGHTVAVVAASKRGVVAAFTPAGGPMWRIDTGRSLFAPALADLTGDGGRCLVVAGDGLATAIDGAGTVLWNAPLPARVFAPVTCGDLDGDGHAETLVLSRTDTHGYLTCLDWRGRERWTAPVTREGDWTPVIADMDARGKPEIIAQLADGTRLGILGADGRVVRTIGIESRICQTPMPIDLDGDGRLDLLIACNESRTIWALSNDGRTLWTHTPRSLLLPGANLKGCGSLLVADIDGDMRLEVVAGDDETWLNAVRTETACGRWAVANGQYHGGPEHAGWYVRQP